MELIIRIKKLASVLLLICLFLPLSQCTGSSKDGKEVTTVHYGYQMLTNPGNELLSDDGEWDLLLVIFIYISLFFAPLITLTLKAPAQQIAGLLLAFPAAYAIFIHLIGFTPRIGIWLAITLWIIITIANLIELYQRIKLWRKNRTQEINIASNH